ncbi:hypothetical protein EMIHUDRAFT_231682 [Emiliania huxleyi CCMP1516]|uniref:Dihydrodipicolinate synthase family protein n=2 Tax=Emiliania huxleyi TaxID=2903 RepID=A0A0D3K6Y6_EMIH1|nr:hypothetical protein EMIHUDRAFT_231682 [Emiliania huxleyi CCMP1516]EOD31521.1 hypothetical protein EMIHUDRAFT_231682 [Emiliania huxleyi CCMP1516]|eukprot:XP_005783950.1 hypothetical protein EMIHUDRAFT_231682 [Emiliania huxleyi CCMP1516]
MATPFRADESLDVDGFQKSMRFMAEAGCDGATIVGVLGESNRMTDRERETLIRAAVDAVADCGRPFPICVGTSHAGTAATVALSQMAQELGAAAVMVTPTKEPAPASDDTLAEMYARVAEGCPGLPIVLQDHPASTQARLEPALRKLWASELPPASDCTILTGLGALYAGFDMEQGTDGFMTGFAFPEILQAMNAAAQRKEWERAHALYQRYLPLLVFEQQPGVAVRKELYRLRGLIECAHVERSLPGIDVSQPLPASLFA